MKKPINFILFLFLLAAIASSNAVFAGQTADGVIVAGKGWGKVILGASRAEIEAVLGKPEDVIDTVSSPNTIFAAYNSKGIVVDYDRKSLRVVGLKFIGDGALYGASNFQSFQGKPDKNLAWRGSVAQIIGSYGTPAERQSYGEFKTNVPIVNLIYPGIKFIFKGDKLFQINIMPDGSSGAKPETQSVTAPTAPTTTTAPTPTEIKLPATTPAQDALGKQLFKAVEKRDTTTALALIKQGANLNSEADGDSTLTVAIRNRDTEMAKMLLEAGAHPDFKESRYGNSPLIMATQMTNMEIVELLINKYKADAKIKSKTGWTPLHTAAMFNADEKITVFLLASGSNPNVVNEDGISPLDTAISSKKTGIVSLLTKVSNQEELARLKKIQASIPKAPKPVEQTTAVVTPPMPKKVVTDPNADDPDEVSSHRLKSISAARATGFTLLDEGTAERQGRNSNDESLGVKQFIAPGEQYQFVMISKDILVVNAVMNGTILNPNCDDCSTSISKYATSYRKSGPDENGYYLISYQMKLTNFQNNYVTFIPKGNKPGEKVKWLFFSVPASKVK